MIKRLLIIASLTGLGHLTTLLSLKYIAKYIQNDTIALIGEIDSLTLLIVAIIAFGLQLSSTRDIALLENWKTELIEAQSARVTLSMLLIVVGLSGFIYTKNYVCFFAPIIALNADYALYGRGMPIMGAFVSLIRVLIPSIVLVIASVYFSNYIVFLFVTSIVFSYFITGLLVSITLKVNYFVRPKFKSLKKYLGNIDIGIASFSMFFIGIGIINVVSYFNDDEAIAIAYIALKFYMIFKGVRRIIVQTFFKELMEDSVSLKVDSFAMVAGLVFFSTLLFYPNAIISLLFSERYSSYTTTFIILGLAGFLSSFTTSSGTRLLLQKKDKAYSWNLIIAALLTVISGILFSVFMKHNPAYISISVLIGEITLSILNIKSLNEKNFITDRMKHTFPLGLLTIIFIGSKYLFGPQLYSYFFALSVYGISVLIYFKLKES
ncbi:lipopolysaccharide biosynthesis protein [Arenibacter troitsensis]|uniref:Membrane protein involved in the export of O-antigen and teichoic acid n=1 Tax=Arenibacter troitsensis TaxID=188872 RepID=A0A1X7KQX1_9FLAO|nr:hypothetical protein [Arenibacter troitsensis]SMG43637.1 hypothetical protein SAMN03080602_03184 [Arenibacter troitsensis]